MFHLTLRRRLDVVDEKVAGQWMGPILYGFGLLELGFMRLLALAARPTTHQNKAAPDQDI
jgi:hypothetical protein